jgi:molecular chaperone HscB
VTTEQINSEPGPGGTGPRPCWSCDGDVDLRAAFCHQCGVIQPSLPVDHFARLGLPRQYDLEAEDLERQYFGFQRSFHPDRFAAKSPREQAISMEYAANINDAYETLKNSLLRAEYLLRLSGREVAGGDGQTVEDAGLLMEVMELGEAIAEADTAERIASLLERTNAEVGASEIALGMMFADNDLDRAANVALRLRYMSKLSQDARQRATALRGL